MTRKPAAMAVLLCAVLACAGMFLATGSARGWIVLAACGSMGIALLFSRATPMLIGLYALLTGISVGLPKIMLPTPTWAHVVAEASFWGSLAAMLSAAWLARARFGERRPARD